MNLRYLGQEMAPSELLARLPKCYSDQFDRCIAEAEAGTPEFELSSYCRPYAALWRSTPRTVWDAAMESIPFCSEPVAAPEKKSSAPLWLFGAGAVGLFLGMMIK